MPRDFKSSTGIFEGLLPRMKNIEIRKLTIEDLPGVLEIENTSFKDPYKYDDFVWEIEHDDVYQLFCAVFEGKIIGYITFMITFDSASIISIAVSNKYRKNGVAKALMDRMLSCLKEQKEPVEWVTLEVRKSNSVAISLYEKHDFKIVTEKKQYYRDGEDAYYMVATLR